MPAKRAGKAPRPAKKAASRKRAPPTKNARKPARAAKPRLLSGGNPQIARGEGDAPVQAYIDAIPDWKRDVVRRLDALVTQAAPHARKAVKWNSPFYGVPGQGWFLSLHCFTRYVKVTFFQGAQLRPLPPGASKHPEVRYLDVREDEPLDEARFKDWARQAAARPGWLTADIRDA